MEEKIVLQPYQIENYIKQVQCFPIEEILSSRWIVQSCRLIQLGIQMVLESMQNKHQDVVHNFLMMEKGVVLVWELITAEAWRKNIVPLLLSECDVTPKTHLPVQLVFQTEAALAGIIEVLLYEEESASAIESLVLDIADWAVRQLTQITALAVKQETQETPNLLYSPQREFEECNKKVDEVLDAEGTKEFILDEVQRDVMRNLLICGMRAVGLLQQMSLRRKVLPLCAGTRMLQDHDVPQLVVPLIELKPWRKVYKNNLYYFEEGQWTTKTSSGLSASKIEVQLWIIVFSLLLDNADGVTYEVTPARRMTLLKLRSHLTEDILRDIPTMEPLSKFFSHLAIINVGPEKSHPLVTTLPQIGETPLRNWKGKWKKLASMHMERSLSPSKEALTALASRFAAAYDLEALEYLLPQAPTCAQCGEPASKKCSRCRTHWYCRRSCQVSHWNKHKSLCDLVANTSHKETPKVIQDIS